MAKTSGIPGRKWEAIHFQNRLLRIYLTDMIFLDVDKDGKKEIIFGTKSNKMFALTADKGVTKWAANVGDEVTRYPLISLIFPPENR